MNKCINIHINLKNMHKNKKSSRHLGRKWYHGTIQSQMNIENIRRMLAFVRIFDDIYGGLNSSKAELREQLAAKQFVDTSIAVTEIKNDDINK